MNLMIENVDANLVRAVKVEAIASGRTLRALVIEALEQIQRGERQAVQVYRASAEAEIPGARPSPVRRSCVSAKPSARKQAVSRPKQAVGGSRPRVAREQQAKAQAQEGGAAHVGEITRCPHGLTWHPGCNA